MYKPEYKPSFRPPQQPQSTQPHMLPHDPNRQPDDAVVTRLFSIVQEGDFSKIIKYISQNNSALGLRDSEGRTALHMILNNDFVTLTDQERYDLARFLINNGVSVNSFDKNNVSALHLATKFQHKDIVRLLLDNGAEAMVKDNQGMNPIHYLSQGLIEKCQGEKKVEDIVPAPTKEVKKVQEREPPQKEFRELTKLIIDIMSTDLYNKFIKNSKRTVNSMVELYPKDVADLESEFISSLIMIARRTDIADGEKERQVAEKVRGLSKTFEEFLIKKLDEGMKPIQYSTDPTKILEKTYRELLTTIKINRDRKLSVMTDRANPNSVMDAYRETSNSYKNISSKINQIYENLSQLQYINKFAEVNQFGYPDQFTIDWDDLKKLYFHDRLGPGVEKDEFNMAGPIADNIPNPRTGRPTSPLVSARMRMPLIVRGTKDEVKTWKRTGIKNVKEYPLTDDINPAIGSDPGANLGNPIQLDANQAQFRNPNYNNWPIYFPARYMYCSTRIQYHLRIIQNNIDALNQRISLDMGIDYDLEICNKIISNITASILNIAQLIIWTVRDADYVSDKIKKLASAVDDVYSVAGNANYPYIFAWEHAVDLVRDITRTFDEIKVEFSALYKHLREIHERLNKILELINLKSATRLMDAYHNPDINDPNTEPLQNLFDRNILLSNHLPSTLNEYFKEYLNMNIEETRKLLYEKHFPAVNHVNYASYYSSAPYPADTTRVLRVQKSYFANKTPYIDVVRTRDETTYPLVAENVGKPKVGFLADAFVFNENAEPIPNPIPNQISATPDLQQEGTLNPEEVDGPDDSKIGRFGYSNNTPTLDRSKKLWPSIGDNVTLHLTIMKTMLVEEIVAAFDSEGANLNVPEIQNLIDSMYQKLLKRTKETFGLDDVQTKKTTQTIIAQIADQLVTDHFKYSIQSAAINRTKKVATAELKDNPTYANILSKITGKETEPLLQVKTGFALNLKKLLADIMRPFTQSTDVDYHPTQFTSVTVRDPEKREEYPIHSFNYSKTGEVGDQDCYIIDPEIVDLFGNRRDLVNGRDISGYTPLNYAVNTLHTPIITKLIEKGAEVSSQHVASRSGRTPMANVVSLYKQHLNFVYDQNPVAMIFKFTRPILQSTIDRMELKYKNNVMRYIDTVFPMLLSLYNHMFYMYYSNYVNGWSYADAQAFEQILIQQGVVQEVKQAEIPLLEVTKEKALHRHTTHTDPLSQTSDNLDEDELDAVKKISNYQHQMQQLQTELDQLQQQPRTGYAERLEEKINQLKAKITEEEAKLIQYHEQGKNIEQNLDNKIETLGAELGQRINKFMGSKKHLNAQTPEKLYQNIFTYVVNDNGLDSEPQYTGYEDFSLNNEMWSEYLNSGNSSNSITNLHLVCVKLQLRLIEQLEGNRLKDTEAGFRLLNNLYSSTITPIVESMEMLPKDLDPETNYVLANVFDSIVYVTRYTICANMYLTILKAVTQYVKSINPKEIERIVMDPDRKTETSGMKVYKDEESYSNFIRELVMKIVDFNKDISEEPDARLEKYIIRDMPKLLVKHTLDWYEGDTDPHREINSVAEIFYPITDLLKNNPAVPVPEDSSLITNLNTYIFPYYQEMFSVLIPQMKVVIYNYNNFITNDGRFVEIMDKMVKQAQAEGN